MKRMKCSCCDFYTFTRDDLIADICPVCFWQYDIVAQKYPTISIGPNHGISLIQARENYQKYGVYDKQFKSRVRQPLLEELPENNC